MADESFNLADLPGADNEDPVEEEEVQEPVGEDAPDDPESDNPSEKPEERPISRSAQRIRAELERRKAAEQRVRELEERSEKMEERYRQFVERLQAPAEPSLPDLDDDPTGNLNLRLQQLERELEESRQAQRTRGEREQVEAARNKRLARFTAQERVYMEEHPDYTDVAQDLYKYEMNRWLPLFNGDRAAAEAKVTQSIHEMLELAEQRGIDPVEHIYNVHKTHARRAPAAKRDPEQEVSRLQESTRRARMPAARGASPSKMPSLADLADAPDDVFNEFMDGDKWLKSFRREGSA